MPAGGALVDALLVPRLGRLNEPEPHGLFAFGARPKRKGLRRRIPKRFWHLHLRGGDSDFRKAIACRLVEKCGQERWAIAAALRRGAVAVLDGRIPVPHRTGRNSRRTPGSARNVRLCLLAFGRDQQATWRRDKNGRHGSRVGPIVAAAAAWRSPSPAGARTVPVLFADYWVTRLCRARILRPSRN